MALRKKKFAKFAAKNSDNRQSTLAKFQKKSIIDAP
jgi:hypothetical protein